MEVIRRHSFTADEIFLEQLTNSALFSFFFGLTRAKEEDIPDCEGGSPTDISLLF